MRNACHSDITFSAASAPLRELPFANRRTGAESAKISFRVEIGPVTRSQFPFCDSPFQFGNSQGPSN